MCVFTGCEWRAKGCLCVCVCLQDVSGGLKDVCVFTGCEWRAKGCVCVYRV